MILRSTPQAVLRSQEAGEPRSGQIAEQGDGVFQAAIDRGLMDQESEPSPLQQIAPLVDEHVQPRLDAHSAIVARMIRDRRSGGAHA
jgi:hypothetical protein